MTHSAQLSTLNVPGAEIYYEVRGSGPTLLIIPGGPQDAGVFANLAKLLADYYTVVTYDPRGNSRSTFTGEPEALHLDVQGDDAAQLISTISSEPAYVFGTSGGAQIGLNLVARHPKRVRVLVVHEPPTTMVLDDPSQALAADQKLYDTYREEGVEAAMAMFFAENNLDDEAVPPEFVPSPEEAETFARVSGNFEYWLAHGMMPLSLYRPDVEVLRAGNPYIVIGIGEQSLGQPIHAMGQALADKLGVKPVMFPGDHMGFGPHADAFAESLHQALKINRKTHESLTS